MDQLSRTSLFSELSDLSVTGIDDGDQYKNIEANVPKTVSKPSQSPWCQLPVVVTQRLRDNLFHS